jgi:hypothetical protein
MRPREGLTGEHGLWLAVLALAVDDFREGPRQDRLEAGRFLFGEQSEPWFAWVCERAGVSPEGVRTRAREIEEAA